MLFGLAVVAAACASGVDDSEGGPSDSPVVTEQSVVTTSTTATTVVAPTTTGEPLAECTEQPGGYAATKQGFVCPPNLPLLETQSAAAANQRQAIRLLPGTYSTRLFEVPVEYTSDKPFFSYGEAAFYVAVHFKAKGNPNAGFIRMDDAEAVAEWRAANLFDHECAIDKGVGQAVIGGLEADYEEFTNTCDLINPIPRETPPTGQIPAGLRIRTYYIDTAAGPVILGVIAAADAWQDYFTKDAQPIIDSIRFLDS